jgi:hypothetical protein
MKVHVLTSDKYVHMLPAFAHCFNTAWSDKCPVNVVYYEKQPSHLPRNFTLVPQGKDPGFSAGLIRYLQMTTDTHLIILLDDYFLIRVNSGMVLSLQRLIKNHPEIVKIDLTDDRLKVPHSKLCVDGLSLVQSNPDAPFLFSIQAAIWRRDFLLRYLKLTENPWQMEKRGSSRVTKAYQAGEETGLVMGCQVPPVAYVNACGGAGNKPGEYDWKKIPGWMVTELKAKGAL